jgi:hypothetical protein
MTFPEQAMQTDQPTVWVEDGTVFRKLDDKVVKYKPKKPEDLRKSQVWQVHLINYQVFKLGLLAKKV